MSKRSKHDDGFKKKGSGVDYSAISDRQVGDHRFERERAHKLKVQEKGAAALKEPSKAVSSTFDAFQRMAAGKEGRSIADKISDPNRPTWEQYKKDNEEKLDLVGAEVRKMVEYRAELDKERESRLQHGLNRGGKKSKAVSDSDDDSDADSSHNRSNNEDDDSSDASERKHKKRKHHKKKDKKHKKHKESKKRKRKHSSDNSSAENENENENESNSDGDADGDNSNRRNDSDDESDRHAKKHRKKHRKKDSRKKHSSSSSSNKDAGGDSPVRLSDFMRKRSDSDSN